MPEKNRCILIVDDNQAIHEDFQKILSRHNDDSRLDEMEGELFGEPPAGAEPVYQLDSAFQGQQAVAMVQERAARGEHYALAFVDMRMPPGWDGVETIERLWAIDREIQIVICTAYSDYSWEQILARFGASDRLLILKKPFDTAEVCQLALALTEKWHLARHAHLKLSQLSSMVAEQTRELRQSNLRLESEISERRQLEASLRASESRYALVAAAANDGLWDWDLAAGTLFYSPRWKAMLGYADDEIGDGPAEWLDRVVPEDRALVEAELAQLLRHEKEQLKVEYRMRHRDGQLRWIACRGLIVRHDGRAVRIAGSHSDITDRHLAEEQLRHEALHDALTGLANRALFADRLRQALLRTRRGGPRFAVLFLDLDRFKLVNDTMGHLAGDQLLIAVAQRLCSCVRGTDTVSQPEPGRVARLGGDEFVIMLEGLRNEEDALRVAERIIAALASPFSIVGTEVHIGVSVGIAFGGPEYDDPESLLRDADLALYQAKTNGKARYELFNQDMHASALSRWRIENELRHAVERGQLQLVYQPIIDARNGRVHELEALLRWQHPERGLISPLDFIPVAEETGLIVPVGAWVLREACRQLAAWDRELGPSDLSVSVNVSGKQLHPELVPLLAEVLRDAGIEPRRLRLEITETALLDLGEATAGLMAQLRELGVRLHLDDFGTGYSSLSYLHQLPVDALKIDRSFVGAMTSDRMSASIVQAVVALAHALGIQVVAEGVETAEQFEQLRRLQCDRAQGYYFSRPIAPALVADMLRRQALLAS